MTDASRNPQPHNPFDTSTPTAWQPGPAPHPTGPSPTGPGREANTAATLSVIFAVVFAASPTISAARPVPTSAPPPPPAVKPAGVPALLPNRQQVNDLTGNRTLTVVKNIIAKIPG